MWVRSRLCWPMRWGLLPHAAEWHPRHCQEGKSECECLGFLPPNPLSLLPFLNMTVSLLRAKVWGQFFCNQYTNRTFSSAYVWSNDHLRWPLTAVSLLGFNWLHLLSRSAGTFWFGQTVTQLALIRPRTKHEENTLPEVLMHKPFLFITETFWSGIELNSKCN